MLAMALLFLSLGFDTLAVAVGLGVGGLPRIRQRLGNRAELVSGAVLMLLGVVLLLSEATASYTARSIRRHSPACQYRTPHQRRHAAQHVARRRAALDIAEAILRDVGERQT